MKDNRGFTLTEIMIVVGIVLIIALIAIPAMVRGKITGNEASAVAALRTISNAGNLYLFQNNNYPQSLVDLTNANPPYIDSSLASANSSQNAKDGYYYIYSVSEDGGFIAIARPSRWHMTGSKCFSIDQSGKLLYCTSAADCEPDLSYN